MEMIFIEDVVGTQGVYSLPVSTIGGGTILVTVTLDELLWRFQRVIVDGVVYKVACYKATIRDRYAQRLVGSKVINVHARESVGRKPDGGEVRGWILTTQ